MKLLIVFALGTIVGVAGVFFYQVFGKPALPTEPNTEPEKERRWDEGLIPGEMIF